jgi:hypothetical protein
MSKRIKHVFAPHEVAHEWFYNSDTIDNGRSKRTGNIYFQGDIIYSYGSHFPIARKVKNDSGKVIAVLFTSREYSNTTSGYKGSVRSAIPGNITIFTVHNVLADSKHYHIENINDLFESSKKVYAKAVRAIDTYNITWGFGKTTGYLYEIKKYSELFNIPLTDLSFEINEALKPGFALALCQEKDALLAKRAAAKNDPKAAEKRFKARAKCAEYLRNGFLKRVAKFRAGEIDYINRSYSWRERERLAESIPESQYQYLRLNSDKTWIETSLYSHVLVESARALWELIGSVRKRGIDFVPTKTITINNYQIIKITAAGDVTIGCHHIKYVEIKLIADELGWSVATLPEDKPLE